MPSETGTQTFSAEEAERAIVNLEATVRHGFVAGEGQVLCDLDFKNQEMYFAGVCSQEPRILRAILEEPPELTIEIDGKEVTYKNPLADLHTMTTKDCCFPHLFVGVPDHLVVATAEDDTRIAIKGNPRLYGKVTNFGIIYFQTAQSMSGLNHVSVEETEQWIERHQLAYPQFHDWANCMYYLSEVRGWARNTSTKRQRWVAEDNSKAAGASAGRSGLNHCLDDQTEALSQTRGWVPGYELAKGEIILTKNADTGYLEWQPVEKMYVNDSYEGEMIEIRSSTFNAVSTPDHRWLVYDTNRRRTRCVTTSELKRCGQHKIPLAGEYKGCETPIYSDAFVKFVGFFLTDGFYSKDGRFGISQSKPETVKYIESFIAELDFKLNHTTSNGCQYWRSRKALCPILMELFPKRDLTLEFLNRLTTDQLALLRDTMLLGDGHKGKASSPNDKGEQVFYASSRHRADMFQTLCLMCGSSSRIKQADRIGRISSSPKVGNKIETKNLYYLVRVKRRENAAIYPTTKFETRSGTFKIWCPTVENSYFVARREGCVFVTGNCIQSMGADTGDLSIAKVAEWCMDNPEANGRIRAYVHDELLVSYNGRCTLDSAATYSKYLETGKLKPVFIYGDEVLERAVILQNLMQDAQSEILKFEYPGLVNFSVAPYWSH